ncbi:hypothetical protein, partial [Oleiphilus sp. HI0061]
MTKLSISKKIILASSLTVLLSACASNQVAISESVQQKSAQAASQSTFTPEQAIDEAEEKLLVAKKKGVEFFSPLHLRQAEESIALAREYLTAPPSDIKNASLMSAIAAQKYIENAYENKKKVEGNLRESLKNLDILESLNAPALVPDQYQDVMESLNDIIQEIEQGNVADAKKSEVDLLEDMADTEISTLKVTHLNEAVSFFERASDIDADEYAELSYEKAEAKLEASTSFIEKNYRDREGVKAAGIDALLATKKAYFVAIEAERTVKMKPEEAEKHVLKVMELLNNIHLATSGQDIEPEKLFNQSEVIIDLIKELKKAPVQKPELPASQIQTFAAPRSEPLVIETLEAPALPAGHKPLEGLEVDSSATDISLRKDEDSFDAI